MPIFSLMIAVQNPTTKQVVLVLRQYNLDSVSWGIRSSVKDAFKFLVRQSMSCLPKYTRHTVKHQDKLCHIQVSKKPVAAYAFTDFDYPKRVIFGFLNQVLQIFLQKAGDKCESYTQDLELKIKEISDAFSKFQNPANADKLTKAIEGVEETKVILHESVKKLLQRQGDLDQLVEKSKDLKEVSKQFYKSSKKMDKSCCQLI